MPREKRKPVKRGAAKSTKKSSRRHGASARNRVDDEIAANKAKEEARKNRANEPFRFRMSQGEVKEVIVVDDEPDFHMYEHMLKDPTTGYYNLSMQCTRDYDNCPVCEGESKESSYNLYLTVIDLTEFDDRNGDTHEFSRKLFVVKTGQIKKFTRRFEKDETLRGAKFELCRDGAKDPVIGNDIEFIEFVSEEELEEYEREWVDKDGKTHVEICHEPYDYDELFPEQDSDELAEEYNTIFGKDTGASAGSRKANKEEPMSKRKKRGRKAKREEEEEDYYEDDEDDDEPPFDMEDEEEEEEEEKPRRRAKKKTAAKKAPARKRRRARDDEEEEEEEKPRRRKPARRSRR